MNGKDASKQCATRIRRWRMAAFLAAAALALVLALAACGGSTTAPQPAPAGTSPIQQGTSRQGSAASQATQTSEGGQVTIEVTWTGVDAGPVFRVAMNTHSVDLDGVDLLQQAVLRTEQGQQIRPIGWDAPKGGHHRTGTLTFPSTTSDGRTVLGSGKAIELDIRDVADVPVRTFKWST